MRASTPSSAPLRKPTAAAAASPCCCSKRAARAKLARAVSSAPMPPCRRHRGLLLLGGGPRVFVCSTLLAPAPHPSFLTEPLDDTRYQLQRPPGRASRACAAHS